MQRFLDKPILVCIGELQRDRITGEQSIHASNCAGAGCSNLYPIRNLVHSHMAEQSLCTHTSMFQLSRSSHCGPNLNHFQHVALLAILFQPALLLIDFGHFQYNSVMLGIPPTLEDPIDADLSIRAYITCHRLLRTRARCSGGRLFRTQSRVQTNGFVLCASDRLISTS